MWLSRVPSPVPDAWHPAFTCIPSVRAAYASQSAEDWQMFLTHRAAELALGGRLVILLTAYADDGARGLEPAVRHMHAERDAPLEAGVISPEQSRRMIVPLLGRSRDDLLAPFSGTGCFEGLEIEHLEVFLAPDPIWEDSSRPKESNAIGENSNSTRRWNDVPHGTMDEVRSLVRLDLPAVCRQGRSRDCSTSFSNPMLEGPACRFRREARTRERYQR
jgi:hypothetical protein